MIVMIMKNLWNFLSQVIYVRRGFENLMCCEMWKEGSVSEKGSAPSRSPPITPAIFSYGTHKTPLSRCFVQSHQL